MLLKRNWIEEVEQLTHLIRTKVLETRKGLEKTEEGFVYV